MPAFHLVEPDHSGITMINIGTGPSNARNITDHVAVMRPYAWLMLGHCAGLRNTQKLGDYVLAHGYVREDHVLDEELPVWVPIPALAEMQVALEQAVGEVTGHTGFELKRVMRTGTVASVDNPQLGADAFTGLPHGTAKPLRFLAAFQEAEPYLGLPVHAYKLVAWLVKQTQPQDWEEGSRPIAWPSARHQAEFLGLSPARVKQLNRALFEAGVFVMRDNEQGKRYGRRDPETKRIIEAFGFDLSPLALRYDEFVRVAAAARVERDRMKGLRRRATLARRAIRQAGEELAARGCEPEGWRRARGGSCRTGACLPARQPVGRARPGCWRPGAKENPG